MKTKLAVVSTHPIQYYSPWFRHLAGGRLEDGRPQPQHAGGWAASRWEMGDGEAGKAESGRRKAETNPSAISELPSAKKPEGFEFEVFYAHRQTAKGQAEAGFGVEFEWDVPVLEGHPYRFLKNISQRPGLNWFGGCDCPEIGEILVREGFTHVLLIGWHKKVFWQAFWAAKKAGIKVLSRGDSQLEITTSPLKRAVKFVAYRFLLPRFDAHLYVGQRNFAYLCHYGVPKDRLFFSPHFVDNQWWGANAERSRKMEDGRSPQPQHAGGWATATPSKMGGAEPPNSHLPTTISEKRGAEFLFAGKFIPQKSVGDLLEAAAMVPEARVMLVGDGPLRPQLEERAGRPDLKGRVEFAGFKNQQELPAYLAATDCLVLCSKRETWGLIVNEGMACGKPAIVSAACGCAPDLIDEGQTGYSFKLGDVQGLAECLRRFVAKKDQDWSGKVRAKISQFTIEKATEGLMRAVASTGDFCLLA